MSNPAHRAAIQQFLAFTQCSERTAVRYLKGNNWSVENAADAYFNAGGTTSPTMVPIVDARSDLNTIFDQFREAGDGPDTIGVSGCMGFFQAIDVALDDPTCLVIAELIQAPTMGEFSRAGFVDGWMNLGCHTLNLMRLNVPTLRQSLQNDDDVFKRVYMFTFRFAKSPGQKSLPLDVAVEYWRLLLVQRFETQLPTWIKFLEQEYRKAVSKDTWNCMYDFVQLAGNDPTLKNYDVDGAWPSILDDFVRYWRAERGEESK